MTTPVLWASTPRVDDAAGSLRALRAAQRRTRLMRSGHWLVTQVFGVIVLGAIPFYITHNCHSPACGRTSAPAPFGRAFNPVFLDSGLRNWATVYWVVAVAAGFALLGRNPVR